MRTTRYVNGRARIRSPRAVSRDANESTIRAARSSSSSSKYSGTTFASQASTEEPRRSATRRIVVAAVSRDPWSG
ncbi:hypothetical protein [Salinadaptatus halalkaliphilus]|uniref:hypothetical protein n=1 Tax=Salinadaptatus halalkaliphilus TaxID=2419781 RepID=UPI001580606A